MKLKKTTDHDYSNKYITTEEFNNLVLEDLAARLAQANKNSTSAFSKKTYSDGKLKNLNKKLTSNKTEHTKAEKKITDLTNKVGQISEKG